MKKPSFFNQIPLFQPKTEETNVLMFGKDHAFVTVTWEMRGQIS